MPTKRYSFATITLFDQNKGGRHVPIFNGYKPEIVINGRRFPVSVDLLYVKMLEPGQDADVKIETDDTVILEEHQSFELYEGEHLVGKVVITSKTLKEKP